LRGISQSIQLTQTKERFKRVEDELKREIRYKIEFKAQQIKLIDEYKRAIS